LKIKRNDVFQKTIAVEEPTELQGNNLRNRNAMQLVDIFDRDCDITVRLTAIYMDYSTTHIGFSIDSPYSDWDITDITIVDERGRTYWASITRGKSGDPFFPIRVITDFIPPDVNKLMISIARIYIPDKEQENGFEEMLTGEEKKIFKELPSLGIDGSISLEIREINKKLRELERMRFFRLPIIKKEIKGRWSFVVQIDHSFRSKIHHICRVENEFTAGDIVIQPIYFKQGILRNELICQYKNEKLFEEVCHHKGREEDEDSVIFMKDRFSPIPPTISILDTKIGKEYLPRGESQRFLNRGAGNLILTRDDRLILHYQFDPFECCGDDAEFQVKGIEMPVKDTPKLDLKTDFDKMLEFPIYGPEGKNFKLPVHISAKLRQIDKETGISFLELKYSYPIDSEVSLFWITESRLYDNDWQRYPVSETRKIEKENMIIIREICEIPYTAKLEDFSWFILNYYYSLKTPFREQCRGSTEDQIESFNMELAGGKVILPGKTEV